MRSWAKTAGIIFLAAASVYSFGAATAGGQSVAGTGNGAKSASADSAAVKVLDEATSSNDPFSNSNSATSNSAATTQPAKDGQSVSADQVNVSDAGNVEIHVNDANLVEVLRMLSLQSQKNIIASKEVRGTVTANLYDVTVREALDAILHANGYAYREKGNFIYVYTTKEIAEIEKAEKRPTTEVFRLFYTPAVNVMTLIKPALSADGAASATVPAVTGMQTGANNTGGDAHATQDAVVVTDYPENLDRVRRLIKEIDRRPQQILVEATILRATLTEDNTLGVDFNILGGIDFASLTHSNGQILNAQLNGGSGSSGSGSSGSSSGSSGTSGGTINNPRALSTPFGEVPNSTGTGTNFTQGVNGFRVGVVSNSVSVFVAALEQITDTTVMANPKVLALNKQSGEVIVGREDGYLTSTVTQTSTVQTVDFLKTGTRLIFRPFIGDDGYIRMEIHPEDSSSGLNGANLPFKITTEVTSNVMVKDGHTIVIGGLFREESTVGKSQVPFLGNIPLAGYLFRKQSDHTQREEIIVLLTPHIIKDDKAYSEASEKEMKEAEKLRVGVRQGMMILGRERLAETEYEKAVEEMKKPNPDRKSALWHLDCATNLNPTFREAIELKEEVSGKEITSVDNSSIHDFVRRQIMADQANNLSAPVLPKSVPLSDDHSSSHDVRPMSTTGPVEKLEIKSAKADSAPATQDVAETPATSQPAEATAETPAATEPSQATAEVPATQNVAEAPAAPATQNVAETPATPATQNVAETPSAPATQNVAETPLAPATQNVVEVPEVTGAAVAKTQAASQPTDNEATASNSHSASTTEPGSNGATASSNDNATNSTQPVAKNEARQQQQQQQNQTQSQQQQQKSTVTELPTEEINSNSTPSNAADSNSNESSK